MRVELGKLLTVLAHELRGPLGVIQGYLRLMLQRHDREPDAQMIKAMLDATGRLSLIGRQAADLSSWTEPSDRASTAVTLGGLADQIAAKLPADRLTVALAETSRATVRTTDATALAAALAAIVDAMSRDAGGGRVILGVAGAGAADVTLSLRRAEPPATAVAPEAPVAASRPFTFDRGGHGLALVMASFVLDIHGATVTTPEPAGTVMIRLQKDRGSR